MNTSLGTRSPAKHFAFKLLRELTQEDSTSNLFFSPASVMLCLAMLYDGAAGETREALATALEIAGTDAAAWSDSVKTISSLLQIRDAGLQVALANSLWCNRQIQSEPDYVEHIRQHYNAEIHTLDFTSPDTVAKINTWVAQNTGGKILNMIDQLNALDLLVGVNAIYFKGDWELSFDKELTTLNWFHVEGSGPIELPFMAQFGKYLYYEESGFQAVRLPYKGSRIAMFVFLPQEKSNVMEFQRSLDAPFWERCMSRFTTARVFLRMPRFTLEYFATLNRALQNLGIKIAFDPKRARFDKIRIPPPAVWIDTIVHRAVLEVNEEGTEASAATMWKMRALGTKDPPSYKMIVDRPFFLSIVDAFTGTPVFMGSISQPVANLPGEERARLEQ